MSHKQNTNLSYFSETRMKEFDLFLYRQFERVEPGFDPDDLPDVFEAWKDNMSDEQYNAYLDEFANLII